MFGEYFRFPSPCSLEFFEKKIKIIESLRFIVVYFRLVKMFHRLNWSLVKIDLTNEKWIKKQCTQSQIVNRKETVNVDRCVENDVYSLHRAQITVRWIRQDASYSRIDDDDDDYDDDYDYRLSSSLLLSLSPSIQYCKCMLLKMLLLSLLNLVAVVVVAAAAAVVVLVVVVVVVCPSVHLSVRSLAIQSQKSLFYREPNCFSVVVPVFSSMINGTVKIKIWTSSFMEFRRLSFKGGETYSVMLQVSHVLLQLSLLKKMTR